MEYYSISFGSELTQSLTIDCLFNYKTWIHSKVYFRLLAAFTFPLIIYILSILIYLSIRKFFLKKYKILVKRSTTEINNEDNFNVNIESAEQSP